jgi:hypothetical protein
MSLDSSLPIHATERLASGALYLETFFHDYDARGPSPPGMS